MTDPSDKPIEPTALVDEKKSPISRLEHDFAPSIEFGICSTCLGSIALMLFFLPILSVPIAACGLLAGGGGILRGVYHGKIGMRWALIGSMLSAAVLVMGIILANAPIGEIPRRIVPHHDWRTPDHPFVSPPATPTS